MWLYFGVTHLIELLSGIQSISRTLFSRVSICDTFLYHLLFTASLYKSTERIYWKEIHLLFTFSLYTATERIYWKERIQCIL